jgi:hypothetical protein
LGRRPIKRDTSLSKIWKKERFNEEEEVRERELEERTWTLLERETWSSRNWEPKALLAKGGQRSCWK